MYVLINLWYIDAAETVTPRAGVWIEICTATTRRAFISVTPRAGVWIEMALCSLRISLVSSLPVRECGLK